MKKLMSVIALLVFLLSAVMAVTNTSVLSLMIPNDTLTVKFARNTSGDALTASDKKFTLNSYSSFSSGFGKKSEYTETPYATSAVTFYVVYQAMVSKGAKIVVTVPTSFKSTTTTDTLLIQSDSTKVKKDDSTIILSSGDNSVQALGNDKVYSGAVKCILALDITGAKKGLTYTGTVTMKVTAS